MFSNVRNALEDPVTVPMVLVALLVLAVFWTLGAVATDRRAREPRFSDNWPLNALKWFGIVLALPAGAIILVAVLWELLALAWSYPSLEAAEDNASDIRWHGSIMLAMLAALGALFTLLFAYIRVFTTERQTKALEAQADAAAEALFNEKINAAANDLHAQRQITIEVDEVTGAERYKDTWQDDIIRRAAAIDRLEGLAAENPGAAPRIARLLSVYVRELSRVIAPDNREHPRADMEKAAQTLGRLKRIAGVEPDKVEIDLRGANLAGFDLSGLCFDGARMHGAQMQGAYLRGAQMQGAGLCAAQMQEADLAGAQMMGADLRGALLQQAILIEAQMQEAKLLSAQMQGADLSAAQMQGATLSGAQMQSSRFRRAEMQGAIFNGSRMQGADLIEAQLQGAFLRSAKMDIASHITAANLRGAAVRYCDYENLSLSQDQVDSVFGDQTVTLPKGITRPRHWPEIDAADWAGFEQQWRAWQREIGFDPDNPGTWDGAAG